MQIAWACASASIGLFEAHRPFLVELRLGDAVGEGRPGRDLAGQRQRLALELRPAPGG
jgi:hypothetical protein